MDASNCFLQDSLKVDRVIESSEKIIGEAEELVERASLSARGGSLSN